MMSQLQEKPIERRAYFSNDEKYRYYLSRIWDETRPTAICIGLNPSKANSDKDDNTISILMKALRANGYGKLIMLNLYGLVTPKPQDLFNCPDALGTNDFWLRCAATSDEDIIFCWGAFKGIDYRVRVVEKIFQFNTVKCFGKTVNGSPNHPRAFGYLGMSPDQITLHPYYDTF